MHQPEVKKIGSGADDKMFRDLATYFFYRNVTIIHDIDDDDDDPDQ